MDWKIVSARHFIDNSNWIEEEERLINWTDDLNLTKQPLDAITITFIYVDSERFITGMLRSDFPLATLKTTASFTAVFNKSALFDTINTAKSPSALFVDKESLPWLFKSYEYEDMGIYTVNERDAVLFGPIVFSGDIAKIPNSIALLHDLYEIVVIMREVPVIVKPALRSVGSKTKKVRISDNLPTKYIYRSVSGKQKTRRVDK
jgi:hypothetical protein